MSNSGKKIETFYDAVTEREWQRLTRQRLQYDIAMRMFFRLFTGTHG